MMRITPVRDENEVTRIRVEGRITALAADELATSCMPLLKEGAGPVLVDLSDVAYADRPGIEALQALRDQGAVLVGSTELLVELLKSGEPAPKSPPEVTAGSEEELLGSLRRGEEAAFEEMVKRHGGRMLTVARRFLRSEEDSRDAVQEAFVSAFRGLDQFSGSARISTWLHRIVVNACLMKLRSRRRKPESSLEDLLPRFNEDGHWTDPVDNWEPTAESLLERQETRAMVRSCIKELPESARTILILRDIEDLDTDEVAAMFGITPNAVKVRLHRARQALRTLIDRRLSAQEPSHRS